MSRLLQRVRALGLRGLRTVGAVAYALAVVLGGGCVLVGATIWRWRRERMLRRLARQLARDARGA